MKLILPAILALISFGAIAAASSEPSVSTQAIPTEGAGPVLKCTSPSGTPSVCKVRIFTPGQPVVNVDLVKDELIAVDGAVVTCVGCSKV